MKKALLLIAAFGFVLLAQAQKATWKEMEDFHHVMSPTFHPAEENNLEPLKKNSADLLAKAQAWQNSTVPAGFKADVTKPILKRLVKQCKLVNKSVKAGKSDAELKTLITTAHDIFHEITEKCRE
ncbi:MAG: hypothetical protein SFU20_13460 [Chitinophagaceae bacterium]|nr:hypothetical protein [Chitinophagaceae bacterium]MBN8666070.1 hypothetical protein [Chitinophagales bacterium]MDX1956533.1 hypothetical protein [Chitinophagaceae bacterium]